MTDKKPAPEPTGIRFREGSSRHRVIRYCELCGEPLQTMAVVWGANVCPACWRQETADE
jgi:hypothetical protein